MPEVVPFEEDYRKKGVKYNPEYCQKGPGDTDQPESAIVNAVATTVTHLNGNKCYYPRVFGTNNFLVC